MNQKQISIQTLNAKWSALNEQFCKDQYQSLRADRYIRSYPHLRSFFEPWGAQLTKTTFYQGVHMIYGWMPRVVTVFPFDDSFDKIKSLILKAKSNQLLNVHELTYLSKTINGSIVGTSKLLHFVQPLSYPIWDSRVYNAFYHKKPHHYRVNNTGNYLAYQTKMNSLCKERLAEGIKASLSKAIGYEISTMRALELILFMNI